MKSFISALCFLLIMFFASFANAQVTTYPYAESFDSESLPDYWSQEQLIGTVLWTTNQGGGANNPPQAYLGNRNLLFYSPSFNGDETILISTEFDLSTLSNPRLSFYHAQYNWDTDQDELRVLYKIGVDGDWIELAEYSNSVNAWTQRNLEIPTLESSVFIGFKAKSGYGHGVVIDEVIVDDAPDCSIPENFELTNTSTESASVVWDSDAVMWQIEYGESGFAQGDGTLVSNIVNQQYSISGLYENTDYQCYVRSSCTGNFSDWVGPISFTTNCDPLSVNNYFEGFEGNSAPPSCWTLHYTNTNPVAANLVTLTTTQSFEGNKSLRFSSYAPGPPYDQYLISPEIQDYTGVREFRFWYRRYNAGGESFRIGYSTTGNNLVTDFTWGNSITDASLDWQLFSMELPEGVKYVVIHYNTVFQYYLYIDNYQILIPPLCSQPENFIAENVTAISAHLNWIPVGDEIDWTLSYGLNGFTPNEGTIVNLENSTYIINNLVPNTEYQAYVRSNCSDEDSDWAGPVSFTTPYGCEQVTNIYANSISSETASIAWSPAGSEESWNIEYGPSGFAHGAGITINDISNQEQILDNLTPNTSYDFYLQSYCGDQFGMSLWSNVFTFVTPPCDDGCVYSLEMTDTWGDGWGNNTLEVYQNGSLTSSYSLLNGSTGVEDVLICDGAVVTLKIQPNTYASEIGIELEDSFGAIVYNLEPGSLPNSGAMQVLTSFSGTCDEPECYPPTNVAVDNISYSSARLNFNSFAEALSVSVSYGIQGFDPEDGTIVDGIIENYYVMSSLIPDTNYDVYIKSACSSVPSIWAGPYSFTTAAGLLDNPSSCSTNITIPDNDCVLVSIDVTGLPYSSLGMDVVLDQVRIIIDHEYIDDIDLKLVSPAGTETLLFSDIGDNSTGFGVNDGTCTQYTTLDMDGVDGSINDAVFPFVGSYIPEDEFSNLYDGTDPNGFWTLIVCDDTDFYTGTIEYVELVFAPHKLMMWSDNIFIEAPANDGSVSSVLDIELFNETFSEIGVLENGTDYDVIGVPEGLNLIVEVQNSTEAIVYFTGNALNHANIDDVTDLSIVFNNSAFTGNVAAVVVNSEQTNISIDFKNLTDISNLSPVPEVDYVCIEDLNNQLFDYVIVNTGENVIPAGSSIHVIIEYPLGTTALDEEVILDYDLNLGAELSGTLQSSVNFGGVGSYDYNLIVQVSSDILPNNDILSGTIIGVSQEVVFLDAVNDSILLDSYPAVVSASLVVNPDVDLDMSYYWDDGISTSNTLDVVFDGWHTCIITTEACAVSDSVFVYRYTGNEENFSESNQINIYPNPAKELFYIEFEQSSNKPVLINMYDINGKRIKHIVLNMVSDLEKVEIDISDFVGGLYLVEINNENHRWYKKLIINQ